MEQNLFADLHVHTNLSDGLLSPKEVVNYAKSVGLHAVSITDHDTTDALQEAIEEGNRIGIEVIPGIELSSETEEKRKTEVHILGYFMEWEDDEFQKRISFFKEARQKRAEKIFEKLVKLGITLDMKAILENKRHGALGRMHFARVMIKDGFAKNVGDAFQKYLGIGKSAYVPKAHLSPEEAVHMILRIGGIPILAHPYFGHYNNPNFIKNLIGEGLQGIEVWHSNHPKAASDKLLKLAQNLGLLATGGSDCHGSIDDKPPLIGKTRIPYNYVTDLINLKSKMKKENQNWGKP